MIKVKIELLLDGKKLPLELKVEGSDISDIIKNDMMVQYGRLIDMAKKCGLGQGYKIITEVKID